MPSITVPFNKLAGIFRKYGVQSQHETSKSLTQVAKRAKTIVTTNTRNVGAVNYEQYLNAWKAQVILTGGIRGVLVGNTRVYAPNIDYGRRPGARRPPIAAIARWAKKKFGITYQEAKKIAWPIAKKIEVRGIAPRQVLRGTGPEKELMDAMESEVGAALDRAVIKAIT